VADRDRGNHRGRDHLVFVFLTLDAYCGIPTLKPKSIINTTINRWWENAF
jgi:hypothetical protein